MAGDKQWPRHGAGLRRRRDRVLHVEVLEERRLLSITPELISKASGTGEPAGGGYLFAEYPRQTISADGRYVVFTSDAANLVSGMTMPPEVANIYRYDRLLQQMDLVSINAAGTGGANGRCFQAAISADGNVV